MLRPTTTTLRTISKPTLFKTFNILPRSSNRSFYNFSKMPLFYPATINSSLTQDLDSLFRLFDPAAQQQCARKAPAPARRLRQFNPSFDIADHPTSYEVTGELPGVQQSDLSIEWADDSTLVIKGHTERTSTKGKEPEKAATDDLAADVSDTASEKSSYYRSPTVEDDGAESQAAPAEQAVEKQKQAPEKAQPEEGERYWLSERSYGEFARSFIFPANKIDIENVRASLKDGLLKISVPKRAPREARRIEIQ
jgi:HSP20 family protein